MIPRRCLVCWGKVALRRGGFSHVDGPPLDLHKPAPGCIRFVGLSRAMGRPRGEQVDIVLDFLTWA